MILGYIDVIAKQLRVDGGFYPPRSQLKQPIDIPVVYEDDHFAIVNKPSGIVVDSQRQMNGRNFRSVLPYLLNAPKHGTLQILTRPNPVHRLDKETSGLLLVAKTKSAHIDLLKQFRDRTIKKTYCALVNGTPDEPAEMRLSTPKVEELIGRVERSIDGEKAGYGDWQLIDHALENESVTQSAITVWRRLKAVPRTEARQGKLTLVELKPQTGRYHQLRRHMVSSFTILLSFFLYSIPYFAFINQRPIRYQAWVKGTPIVGDKKYDHAEKRLMDRGMFLCSNQIKLEHPYYNTVVRRNEFLQSKRDVTSENGKGCIFYDKKSDKVFVLASIPLPDKFSEFVESAI